MHSQLKNSIKYYIFLNTINVMFIKYILQNLLKCYYTEN